MGHTKRSPGVAAGALAVNSSENSPHNSQTASKWQRRAAAAAQLITVLAEFFPRAFFVYEKNRRPLKRGIDHDLVGALAGAATAQELKTALRSYTSNIGYLHASKPGAARLDLQGNPAGEVTAEEAEHARQRLAARWQQRRAAPEPRKAPEPKVQPTVTVASKPSPQRLSLNDLRAAARARKGTQL